MNPAYRSYSRLVCVRANCSRPRTVESKAYVLISINRWTLRAHLFVPWNGVATSTNINLTKRRIFVCQPKYAETIVDLSNESANRRSKKREKETKRLWSKIALSRTLIGRECERVRLNSRVILSIIVLCAKFICFSAPLVRVPCDDAFVISPTLYR